MNSKVKDILRRCLDKPSFCKAVEGEDWEKVWKTVIGYDDDWWLDQIGGFGWYLYNGLGANFLEKMEEVPEGCFFQSDLESIDIPDSIETIGVRSFAGCERLKSVSIPNSVQMISEGAFQDCYNLEDISLPFSLKWVGKRAFRDCTCLKTVILPDSIKELEMDTFRGCKSLTSIYIPPSVTKIATDTFEYCNKLIIECEKDSYAHMWCKLNKFPYKAT